jgi:colanic acid/amylovoran biosynthesis protein
MNIYVFNCPNTFNYGSMMMGENFIHYFNLITGEHNKYFIETLDKVNIERLITATNYKNIYSVKMKSLFKNNTKRFDYILSLFGFKNILSSLIKTIDLVVVLGGDDFTEDYGWQGPIMNSIRFNIIVRAGVPVVMLGQTMGPYHSFRSIVMKKLLNNITKIYPRDPITFEYLETLGLKNISLTDDLALLPLYKQKVIEKTKEYITYCPSEQIYKYSKDRNRDSWIEFNLYMIKTIIERYPEKKIVLLAHVLKPDDVNDGFIANELYELVKTKYADKIILKSKPMLPFETRIFLQKSLFVVSSRMHPIISSIQCEIPSIAISYSSKYWGIIGKRFDLEDFILDVRYLDYETMKQNFITLLNKIEIEYEGIQRKLIYKNSQARQSIDFTLSDIYSIKKF